MYLYNKKENDKQNTKFLLVAVLLSVFCILKVLRGSNTESTASGGIWNFISLFYYFILLVSIVKTKKYRLKPLFIASITYIFFAVFAAIYNLNFELNISNIYEFLMIPYAVIVFLSFYLCSGFSSKAEKIILFGYFGCIFLNIYSIFKFRFAGAAQAMESDIYFSLGLFPFALQFLKNKRIKILVIILEFVAVFMVNKRTALISFVLALIVYLLVGAWIEQKNKFLGTLKTLLISGISICLFYFITKYIDDKYNMQIYYRLFRLAEDGGSGRDVIYEKVWEAFKSSTIVEQLFGHGMNTAGKVGGAGHAHNDFLEILYNYGMIACISSVMFYVLLFVECIRSVKRKSPYAASFSFSFVVGIFLAMFSYFLIFYTYVTCIMAFWGYVLCMEKKHRLKGHLA